jgi:hypothetical protein
MSIRKLKRRYYARFLVDTYYGIDVCEEVTYTHVFICVNEKAFDYRNLPR